jgi:hypothetical protein
MVERGERIDQTGIELLIALAEDLTHRVQHGPRLLVRTLMGESIKDVSNSDDPTSERDLFSADAMRIAGAVPALVMGQRDPLGNAQQRARAA